MLVAHSWRASPACAMSASPNFDDMAFRQAIGAGAVPGPRMQNAGNSFGITGGHCDENG